MVSSSADHGRFLRSKYFGSLDGLRGISIIAVVWHHAARHQTGILGQGALGVQLFFAISGFLITTLLLRERQETGDISLKQFYIRRALRIFPLYYAAILLYVLVVTLLERHTPAGSQFYFNLRYYLTYTSNWFVRLNAGERVIFYYAWSLATEEQFYLFWPSMVRFGRGWRIPVISMAVMLLAGEACRWAVTQGTLSTEALGVRMVSSIATPICLGCLSAFWLHSPSGFSIAKRILGKDWSAPLALVALVLVVALPGMPMFIISVAMVCLVVSCVVRPEHRLRPILQNRVIGYVGTVSYGMYLLHMLAINLVRRLLGAHEMPLATFLLALVLAIGMAGISFRFFEQRFLRLKDRFKTQRRVAVVPAVAND